LSMNGTLTVSPSDGEVIVTFSPPDDVPAVSSVPEPHAAMVSAIVAIATTDLTGWRM
jgi:hypothetical protein